VQKELGDLVFVELPEEGSSFKQGEKLASVESVKAVSDIYAPISGTVGAINTKLSESPDLVSSLNLNLNSVNSLHIPISFKDPNLSFVEEQTYD
jgi:glycine cleavage system H lipoate-binding protein